MKAVAVQPGTSDFSRTVIPEATIGDLDPIEFERFRRVIRRSGAAADHALESLGDPELLKALNVIEGDTEPFGITISALLLFGKEHSIKKYLITHEVAFQVLEGTNVVVNRFFNLPLFNIMEDFFTIFQAHNEEKELVLGMERIGIPDVSERAFREALANALIHRDYTSLGAVHVQWHDEFLEISSPGGFPEGVNLNNILVTPPTPRNPLLADAFKRAGIVERTGRGIDIIFLEQLKNGRPAPDYNRSSASSVIVSLPCGAANLNFVKFVVEESQAGRPLRLIDFLLLNGLWIERRLDADTASRIAQRPPHEARSYLEQLVEAGLVDGMGDFESREYRLTAETYRRLGDKAAYVRQSRFTPLQRKQLILEYVDNHGKITRREAAELCRIEPEPARRLLKDLVDSGKLDLLGEKRGAYYILKPSP